MYKGVVAVLILVIFYPDKGIGEPPFSSLFEEPYEYKNFFFRLLFVPPFLNFVVLEL